MNKEEKDNIRTLTNEVIVEIDYNLSNKIGTRPQRHEFLRQVINYCLDRWIK